MLLVANLPIQNDAKKLKDDRPWLMVSTQQELSNEYQHDRVNSDGFQRSMHPCALDKSCLSIRRLSLVFWSYPVMVGLTLMLLMANLANTK